MIRAAEAADSGPIYRLVCQLERCALPEDAFQAILRAQLADPRHVFLILEEEGSAAGLLHLRLEPQLHHAALVAEILEFVVDEPLRGRGLGAALLREAARQAKERGCAQLEVACNQTRTASHRFYESQGLTRSHYKFAKPL